MMPDDSMQTIQQLLRSLGISSQYSGFPQTAYAIQLSIQDPDRLHLITKLIYPDVAGRYRTTWTAVERNMRTVVAAAWKNDPFLLGRLAGARLSHKPTNGQFLSILSGLWDDDDCFCAPLTLLSTRS